MPDLSFQVLRAESLPFAAAPMLALSLQVKNRDENELIHTVTLRAQIQIEATRRRYTEAEQEHLLDLFGEPDRWSRTLRPLLWTHASTIIPSFNGTTLVELQLPCTFDFNVAATKYFHGLTDGEIPLNLLFSGTVFYADQEGRLQVSPVSWDKEARYRLPLQVWREMIDSYYPNSAWLTLRRDVFDRVYQYKMRHGIASWEEALERLLDVLEPEAARQ
jgi:hypothetical protein